MRFLAGLLALGLLNFALPPSPKSSLLDSPAALPPGFLRHPAESVSVAGLGLRRLGADLAMLRLNLYYGAFGHEDDPRTGPSYPEIAARAASALAWDPSFGYAPLYGAGALAFNLNRPQEALALLSLALRGDPGNVRLKLYIGAVGFARHGDMEGALKLLLPLAADPAAPTLLKSVTAYLCLRLNRYQDAARLYQDILAHSQDEGYRKAARRNLARLGGTEGTKRNEKNRKETKSTEGAGSD